MEFSPIIPKYESASNTFSSSLANERQSKPRKKVELPNLFVTEYPHISLYDLPMYQFAFTYFKDNKVVFSANQDKIVHLSTELFGDSKLLNEIEQIALNTAFSKSAKAVPSRPNRL